MPRIAQFTFTKVGISMLVTSPVSLLVMASCTDSSDRTKLIVWPPKVIVPRSCGFAPKIASVICDDSAESRRDWSWRANRSASELFVVALRIGIGILGVGDAEQVRRIERVAAETRVDRLIDDLGQDRRQADAGDAQNDDARQHAKAKHTTQGKSPPGNKTRTARYCIECRDY